MNTLFQNILTASFHGSIVILAVMLLRLVLKKTPRKYIAARTRPTPFPFPKRTNTFPRFSPTPSTEMSPTNTCTPRMLRFPQLSPCRHATPISPYSTGGNSGSSTGATCNKAKPTFMPWVPTSCIFPSISRRNTSETSPIPSSCGQTGQLSHYVPTRHDDRHSPSLVNILYITTKCTTATPLLGQGFKHRTIQHSKTP